MQEEEGETGKGDSKRERKKKEVRGAARAKKDLVLWIRQSKMRDRPGGKEIAVSGGWYVYYSHHHYSVMCWRKWRFGKARKDEARKTALLLLVKKRGHDDSHTLPLCATSTFWQVLNDVISGAPNSKLLMEPPPTLGRRRTSFIAGWVD